MLKGFFDRVLYADFAYKKDPFWDKLLKGRSAHIVATSDAPALWLWLQYRNSDVNTVRRGTLEFCGFSSVRVTRVDRVKYLTDEQRKRQLGRMTL